MRCSGRNFLRSANAVAASSSHALYPALNLYDGDPTCPWVAATSGVSNVAHTIDLADRSDYATAPGTYEAGVANVGENRSTGAGSVADEAALVHGGSKALKVLAGAGGIGRHVLTYTARPGEVWRYSVWLRGDGTGSARLRIFNPLTGNWWVSGAWSATEGDVAARSAASYAESTGAVTLEDYAAIQSHDVPLEVHVVCTDSGQVGYADDVFVWPSWDLVSLHGHNWAPRNGVEVSGSDDGSTWTVLTTVLPARPTCYAWLGALQAYRHVRVRAVGVSPVRPYLGELWVGHSVAPVAKIGPIWTIAEVRPQLRHQSFAGHIAASTPVADAPRTLELPLVLLDEDQQEALQAFLRSTLHGVQSAVLVPHTDRPEAVLGRMSEEGYSLSRGPTTRHLGAAIRWTEDGFPTVAA